jgi:hypothetical protein
LWAFRARGEAFGDVVAAIGLGGGRGCDRTVGSLCGMIDGLGDGLGVMVGAVDILSALADLTTAEGIRGVGASLYPACSSLLLEEDDSAAAIAGDELVDTRDCSVRDNGGSEWRRPLRQRQELIQTALKGSASPIENSVGSLSKLSSHASSALRPSTVFS